MAQNPRQRRRQKKKARRRLEHWWRAERKRRFVAASVFGQYILSRLEQRTLADMIIPLDTDGTIEESSETPSEA